MKLEIDRVATLGMDRISDESEGFLSQEARNGGNDVIIYEKASFGYYIYLNGMPPHAWDALPDDVKAAAEAAKSGGATILCLDADSGVGTCTMLTLSTAYLTEATRDTLEKEPEENKVRLTLYDKSEYGWFLDVSETALAGSDRDAIPEDLLACVRLARHVNADILCFDRDAEPCWIPGLRTYN